MAKLWNYKKLWKSGSTAKITEGSRTYDVLIEGGGVEPKSYPYNRGCVDLVVLYISQKVDKCGSGPKIKILWTSYVLGSQLNAATVINEKEREEREKDGQPLKGSFFGT